jgi:hypothetical protein
MARHRGVQGQDSIRFFYVDDGLFTIRDGIRYAGCIRLAVIDGRRKWVVRDATGRILTAKASISDAKDRYLMARGLPPLTPPPPEMVRVQINHSVWEAATEWRAAVWNKLGTRYRAPVINRLMTPVDSATGFLVFAWPKELVEYWRACECRYT